MSYEPRNNPNRCQVSTLFAVLLLVSMILACAEGAPVQAAGLFSPAPTILIDPGELGAFLDDLLSAQLVENHIPGATISVVKDGQLFFAKGYGACDMRVGKPVSAQTSLFQIGSVGKLVTAAAVMQLAEQGKLDLHADVNSYLKTFQIPATYPEPVTLAHLLTHTAGFEDHITGSDAASVSDLEPLSQWLAEHLPARVRRPGELTAYSNYGFALAGYIVEQVSGLPYAQYLDQNIFQPLQMQSSTFRQPVPQNLSAGLCISYTYANGTYHPNPFELLNDLPAGSFTTTAADMANFMIAMLQQGSFETKRIFRTETARMMQAQQFDNDPRVSGETYGFEEQNLNDQRLIVHSGLTASFSSLLILLPEHQIGVFVSYNSEGGLAAQGSLMQAFLDHYFPAREETLPVPPTGSAARIGLISGDYWPARRGYTTYEKILAVFRGVHIADGGSNRLAISSIGSTPWLFTEVAPWVFRRVDGPQAFVFRVDPGGAYLFIAADPAEAYIKIPWYDAPGLHLAINSACVLLFLSALLLWPVGFARRMIKRAVPTNRQGKSLPRRRAFFSRLARCLAGGLCALNVFFLIGLALFLSRLGPYPAIFRGVTPLLAVLFGLAMVSSVLAVCTAASAVLAWWTRFWDLKRRIHFTLVALAAAGFALELIYWNMVGFRI